MHFEIVFAVGEVIGLRFNTIEIFWPCKLLTSTTVQSNFPRFDVEVYPTGSRKDDAFVVPFKRISSSWGYRGY